MATLSIVAASPVKYEALQLFFSHAVEVVITLFAWKILYPNAFFLARGNHETKAMNKAYGFEGEVKHKYGELAMELFSEVPVLFLKLYSILINDRYSTCSLSAM